MDGLRATPYGPCGDSKNKRTAYLNLSTNEHGVLQIHPCHWCQVVFVWHPEVGWVFVKDETLAERVKNEVRQAAINGAEGFEQFKDSPVYVKGFMG